jgi:parallel beta-helix repeat protein
VIRGLELRHNRQPGGQWSMVSVGQCERVVVEDCGVYGSDFCGLGVGRSRDCTVRRCDLSYNGNTGLGIGECRDCTIEDCTLLFNNYPYQRTVASNHADYNVYANAGWTPTLRHSWNPDNSLTQWQQRFQEDLHSSLLPVAFELTGTRFALKNGPGLNRLAPLPDEVRAVLPAVSQVGCRRTEWPPNGR